MQDKKNDRFNGMQERSFASEECQLRVLNEEERTVEISFSSETPIKRWGAYEVLSHKSGAVMLERINTTGCLLFNHDRNKVIGRIEKAEVKNKRGVAVVRFDNDDESTIYFDKVKNETLRGVSVGYVVHEMERSVKGKGENVTETYTATRWEPVEISIVSVPADITVGVGRSIIDSGINSRCTKLADYQMILNQNILKARKRRK